MIYLLHYNRGAGRLVSIREFTDDQRAEASESRLALEISLLCESNGHEVVLLEADSEDELKKTHRRYFESLQTMRAGGKDNS